MSRPQNPHVIKAFNAMKALDIKPDIFKPVLKRLLKLYDNKWELIEEDNYRTLVDAIFESEDEKKNDGVKVAAEHYQPEPPLKNHQEYELVVEHDAPEPPLKKHHGIVTEDKPSSTMENGYMQYMRNGRAPRSSSALQSGTSSVPTPGAPKIETNSSSGCVRPRNNGKYSIAVNLSPMGQHMATRWTANSEAHQVSDEHVKGADNANVTGHVENVDVFESEQPLDHLRNFPVPASGVSTGTFDLASSACGWVKIALKSNCSSEQHKVEHPFLDSVLAFVESKYGHLYHKEGHKFSLHECLKELCQSYVEFSAKPASNLPSGGHPGDHLHPIRQHINESFRSEHIEQNVKKKMASGSASSTSFTASNPQPAYLSLWIPDISKETETVSISLADEISGEKEPLPKFVYIPSNIVYQSAYVHVSLAKIAIEDCCSGCGRDCISSAVPCTCAHNTGGEFAYTPEGLVKEEFLRTCIMMNEKAQHHFYYCKECPLERAQKNHGPKNCKGHLTRRFIKECWRKCGCDMSCGNRVVQRGISRKLQVFLTSDGKGWGLRTLEVLPKGAFVCEYIGEILTNLELFERIKQNSKYRHTYPVLLDADWGSESILKDEDALCLDATHFGNVARFINHRCYDANLIEIPVEVENPKHHYYHLALFTKRKVDALEELTWDYQIDFADQNHPVKAFQCYCRSALCRDRKGKGVQANV